MTTKAKGSKPPLESPAKSVSSVDAADTLGHLLNRVAFGREEIVITRHNKPVAKLVPIEA